MNFVNWYTNKLVTSPLITKGITSFIMFGGGDILCQMYFKDQSKKEESLDYKRALKQASFGLAYTPYFHFSFNIMLPGLFNKPGTANLVKLVIFDQTFNSTVFILCFFSYLDFFNGLGIKESLNKTKGLFLPTLVDNWKLWPLAQVINFTIIPPPYRVFFANIVGLFWNFWLSYIQNVRCKQNIPVSGSDVTQIQQEANKNI